MYIYNGNKRNTYIPSLYASLKDYNDEKYFYSNIVFDSSDLLFTNQYILCKTYSDRHKLFCRSGQ